MPSLNIRFKPNPTFDNNPIDFITTKYKSLHKTLTDLLTDDYKSYMTGIYIVAPKPTTFKVVLHNNQEFILTYLGPSYSCKVEGKKYYLNQYAEKLSAINAIARLLELGQPLGLEAGGGDEPEGPDDLEDDGSGAGGGTGGEQDAGGAEEEAPEELAEQKIRINMKEGIFGKKLPFKVQQVINLTNQGDVKGAIAIGDTLTPQERDLVPDSVLHKLSFNEEDEEPSASDIKKAGSSEAKKHKQLIFITQEMKKLAGQYKKGDKSVIPALKKLTADKKRIEAELLDSGDEIEESSESPSIPSNIAKFAKRKGVSSKVKTIAKWVEQAGKKISGGTAVGKNYDTLILDLNYQDGAIAFYIDTGMVTLYSRQVTDAKSFAKVLAFRDNATSSVEEGDINDPVLMKMRAAKSSPTIKLVKKSIDPKTAAKIKVLQSSRARIMADMEQEAEPEGGPIANRYGEQLNRIDNALAKLTKTGSLKEDQSMARATKAEAIELAKSESKKCGCAQHVQKKNGYFYVDDWYDYETTVASFQNGQYLNESKLKKIRIRK